MMSFWILAAGLLGIALLFAILPLFRQQTADGGIQADELNLVVFKQQLEELNADLAAGSLDQAQYDASKRDLEKELLSGVNATAAAGSPPRSGRWAAPLLALIMPLLAIAVYWQVGDQAAIARTAPAPAATAAAQGTHDANMASMDVLIEKLAQRLQTNPSAEGWVMLGRSYLATGKNEQATQAYGEAMRLAPEDPDTILGYAEALAKTQGGLQGEAAALIARALALDPANPNSLWMMGLVEYQRGDSAKAVQHWTSLQAMLEPGSEDASTLGRYIAEARQEAGFEALPQAAAATQSTAPAVEVNDTPDAATSGAAIQVQVSLAPGLEGRFSPQDTLFVFARAVNGPPMPLAVQRLQAKDLPLSLTLDDSMAMMAQMRLSNFAEVVVGARISKSGNAMPQTGDLQGEIQPIRPGQAEIATVVIDSIRP
jgi:cytochrome c-type biogenesis protein CcmH